MRAQEPIKPAGDTEQDGLDLFVGGRAHGCEAQSAALSHEHAVGDNAVEVDVEVEGAAKALGSHRTGGWRWTEMSLSDPAPFVRPMALDRRLGSDLRMPSRRLGIIERIEHALEGGGESAGTSRVD